MKKGKRLLCGALALLLVLSLTAVGTVQRAYATKSEEDQAAEEQKKAEEAAHRQAEMDELERKKQEKKDRIAELQKQIADAKSKKEDVMGTKTLLDQRNQLLMEEIDDTKAQIDLYAEQIQVYQEMEEEQYALFCRQVRSEEERGSLSYWSVLFKATSISDLLSRLEFVNEVAEYDRSLMEAIRQTRENIKTEKARKAAAEYYLRWMPEGDGHGFYTPGSFNQALMDLGATICLPNRAPLCADCPLQDFCTAHARGEETAYPVMPEKKARRIEDRTVFLIHDAGKIVIGKRPPNGLLASLYEFPNTEGHLSEADALRYVSGLGIQALRIRPLPAAKHIFSHIEWHMIGYAITVDELAPFDSDHLLLVSMKELAETYSIPSAFAAYRNLLPEEG